MWSPGTGVVEFPNGIRVRGRALRAPMPEGPLPEFGVYLQARQSPVTSWPMVWIKWPDFRLPPDRRNAAQQLVEAFDLAGSQRVEVACRGGRGRTGTALAVMALAAGVDRDQAVDWVRSHYHPRAVETRWQRRWIRQMELDS